MLCDSEGNQDLLSKIRDTHCKAVHTDRRVGLGTLGIGAFFGILSWWYNRRLLESRGVLDSRGGATGLGGRLGQRANCRNLLL